VEVEFDARKNAENIRKHGISLQRAEDFDMDSAHIDMDDSQDYGEVRYNAIGWLGATLHSFTFTIREDALRAISLRKANKRERKSYAEKN
jgi:uncharacterized DUF497 family protein